MVTKDPVRLLVFFQLLRSPACSDNYMRAQPTCHAGYQWFRLEAPQEIPRIIVRSQIFRHKEEDYDVLMRIRDQNPRTIPPFFSLIIFQKNCRDLKLRSNQKFVKRIHRHRFIWFSKYNTIFSCDEQLMKWGCHSVCSFVRSAPTKEFFLSLKSFNGVSRKFKGCLKFEGCFKEVSDMLYGVSKNIQGFSKTNNFRQFFHWFNITYFQIWYQDYDFGQKSRNMNELFTLTLIIWAYKNYGGPNDLQEKIN